MSGCIIPRALHFHFLGGFGFRDGTHHQVYWTKIPLWDSPLKFCDSVGLVSVWQWKSSKESITDLLKSIERYCNFESIFFSIDPLEMGSRLCKQHIARDMYGAAEFPVKRVEECRTLAWFANPELQLEPADLSSRLGMWSYKISSK